MIGKTLNKPFLLGRSIKAGIRIGVFILTVACTITIARIGWKAFQGRTGNAGGEMLIIPMIILLIYIGWTASEEWMGFKRAMRKSKARKRYRNKKGRTLKERPNHSSIISPRQAVCQSRAKNHYEEDDK